MLNGTVHPDFREVGRTLTRLVPRSGKGGASVCVYHHGEKVVDAWAGTKNSHGAAWEESTLSLSYSTTKGVASTLLHVLVDRGLIDYDDPVADVWPEFAQAGKSQITIRQLMCHEAGLYDIRSIIDRACRMIDWGYMTRVLAAAKPAHVPGRAHGYHGLTYGWLVGEVVQRVTGKPFSQVVEDEIAAPLGLDGLFIGLPDAEMSRRAELMMPEIMRMGAAGLDRTDRWARGMSRVLALTPVRLDPSALAAALVPRGMKEVDFNAPEYLRVPIPAANGMFTARSLARMYALLANEGELDGVRLLQRETVWRASEVQNRTIGRVIPVPLHWRLGYHRVPTLGFAMPNGFGHFGFGGSGAWADPDRKLAVALTLNSGTGTPFGDLRMLRIGTSATRCAERRS